MNATDNCYTLHASTGSPPEPLENPEHIFWQVWQTRRKATTSASEQHIVRDTMSVSNVATESIQTRSLRISSSGTNHLRQPITSHHVLCHVSATQAQTLDVSQVADLTVDIQPLETPIENRSTHNGQDDKRRAVVDCQLTARIRTQATTRSKPKTTKPHATIKCYPTLKITSATSLRKSSRSGCGMYYSISAPRWWRD